MKAVLDLTKAITDGQYYNDQFEGSGNEKNILFLEPQLTSSHLYKFILPFFCFYNEKVYTAITGLSRYDPYKQIVGIDNKISESEIIWADFIVIPFTTMDLSKEYGLYQAIKEVNPACKIVFFVDFNFYELPENHPHKELFDFKNSIDSVEKNILYSDLCLCSNVNLRTYLINKFTKLANSKYKNIEDIPVLFGAFPYLIDEEIVLQNVEFDSHKPEYILNREIFRKVAEVAEEIKKEDLENNKEKADKVETATSPKKINVKTTKVQGKRGRKKKIDETLEPAVENIESKEEPAVENKPAVEPTVEPAVENIEPVKEEIKELPKKYRIGIICSNNNQNDIKEYNQQFQEINDRYGDDVTLIFLGYDYKEDKNKILDGVNFEYIKQVSIIHYFKQLQSLNLDLVFVPLTNTMFNVTTENVNKFLECGIFKIPVITDEVYPYSGVITNDLNGFMYKGKENFITELDRVLRNPDLVRIVSEECKKEVSKKYSYNLNNLEILNSIYSI